MDMLGHCEIALRSGVHDPEVVYGDGLLDLMLPNLMHCHDWAYATMWRVEERSENLQTAARLIRTHMVADWIIHYGCAQTHRKLKCGWAYRHMGLAKVACIRFFSDADARGMLRHDVLLPHKWDKKRKLDFYHSIIEYCLDILFAQELEHRHFLRMKAVLSNLYGSDNSRGRRYVYDRFSAFGAFSDQDTLFLQRSLDSMGRDALLATRPDHFAIATVIRKYGFIDEPVVYTYVRTFLEQIAADLDTNDIKSMMQELSAAAADPLSIYTGELGASTSPAYEVQTCLTLV